MTLDEYQRLAMRTAGGCDLACAALGLAGESGEFADHVKKILYHGHEMDRDAMAKELGDVLWYVALAASTLGIGLGDIAAINIEKLRRRYPDGFSIERSINREE